VDWRAISDWFGGWRAYDPSWLVAHARRQFPEQPQLAEAFAACVRARGVGGCYVRFVDSARPNQPGSQWQFDRNVTLEDTEAGDVIVDVLKDGRIGGIELLDVLLGRR
jgi:hypothetical protein